jgi:hypothetical protein
VTRRGVGERPAPASKEDGVMRAHPEGEEPLRRLRVVAGARRTELAGAVHGAPRVRVVAPPAQGRGGRRRPAARQAR